MRAFLWGEEDFLLFKKIQFLREKFIKNNPQAPIARFDFEEGFDIDELIKTIHQGGGLFSQKELVIGTNIFSLTPEWQIKLLETLSDASSDIEIILFHNGSISKYKKSKLYKFFEESFEIIQFQKISPAEMKKWLLEEISDFSQGKVKIKEDVLGELVSISGGNLWFLDNELKKLVNYAWDEGAIEKNDLEKISYGKAESKIFDLVDAIGQKNRKRALDLVSKLLSQGENAFYVFTMIAFQVRNLAKVFGFQGQDAGILAKKLGMHPFVIKKTQNQLSGFSKKEIQRAYEVIARFDYEMKTGRTDAEKALYDLAVSI